MSRNSTVWVWEHRDREWHLSKHFMDGWCGSSAEKIYNSTTQQVFTGICNMYGGIGSASEREREREPSPHLLSVN